MFYLATVVWREIYENHDFSDVNLVCIHLFWLVCRMTLIFFQRKDMILDNLSNMLNMVVRPTENFLTAFEKKFHVKNSLFEA